jgi:hypothetical protein
VSRHRRNAFNARGRSSHATKALFGIIAICAIVIMLAVEQVIPANIGGIACAVLIIIAYGVFITSVTNR